MVLCLPLFIFHVFHFQDPSALVVGGPYHDEKQFAKGRDDPRWVSIDVKHEQTLPKFVGLAAIKKEAVLADMELLTRARLSCQRVTPDAFAHILQMGGAADSHGG